ncbi:MAG: hypothetical protein NVS4B5_03660 [Vulcanimicrobiaceae bacterium]
MIPLAAVALLWATETARPARAFVESVGVNLHLHYNDTAYYDDFEAVKQRLRVAHIRHVRDGLIDTTWQPFYDRLNELGAAGIRCTVVTNVKESLATVLRFARRVPAIEAIEGPNEYDRSGDPAWPKTLADYVRQLHAGLKADRATARLELIGPSLTSADAYRQVGDLDRFVDRGNMHDYTGGFPPGTDGFGEAGFGSHYGSVLFNRNVARQATPSRPIVATEAGYGTASATHANVPESVQGKYLPRLLLEHTLRGIPRTYIYQFVDEGDDGFGNYGLLHKDLSPKPAFTAIRDLLTLLDAPGSDRSDALRYALAGAPDLAHALFEKPDGTFVLVSWLETSAWDVDAPGGGAPISVAREAVTVRFARPIANVVMYESRADGTLSASRRAGGNAITFDATDAVSVMSFRVANQERGRGVRPSRRKML